MHRGYIKKWRKELDNPIWEMPELYRRVWDWTLYRVDYKTGQMKTSYNQVADGVAWMERGIRRVPNRKTIMKVFLWLEAHEMIKRLSNRHYTELTVVNWELYQGGNDTKVTPDGQQDGHPLIQYKALKEEEDGASERKNGVRKDNGRAFLTSTIQSDLDRLIRKFSEVAGREPFNNKQRNTREVPGIKQDAQALLDRIGYERFEKLLVKVSKEHIDCNDPLATFKAAVHFIGLDVGEKKPASDPYRGDAYKLADFSKYEV